MSTFTLSHSDTTEEKLPPSLHIEGLNCTRRLWLKYHHIVMDEDSQWKARLLTLKSHLGDEFKHDWRFELRLPSGSRIDAWIPDEHVFIEFKTARPHASHVYQVWMMIDELKELGIQGVEFQLWYSEEWKKEAIQLAETLNFDAAENETGLTAIFIREAEDDFRHRRLRDSAIFSGDLEKKTPPPVKTRDKSPCRECSYFEFCHS